MSTTIHTTKPMKPTDVKRDSFAEYNEEYNEQDPKFKIGDHARVSKNKNIFAKGYVPDWSEEIFVAQKIKTYCTLDICNL